MQGKVSHYVFVGSAGAYKANKVEPVLTEGEPRKESAGHVAVEKYLEEQVCSTLASHISPTALVFRDSPGMRAILVMRAAS